MVSVVPGPAMKRHFSLDLRYVFNFVCDFSALLTFPDAQAISKVTAIPYVAVIPLLPTRGWRYIFHYSALTILRKYSVNIWRSLNEKKNSSRRGLARLFTSVHGHKNARRAGYSSLFCGSLSTLWRTICPQSFGPDVGRRMVRVSLFLRLHLDTFQSQEDVASLVWQDYQTNWPFVWMKQDVLSTSWWKLAIEYRSGFCLYRQS